MKKYLKYILLLVVAGGAFAFYMYNKPHKNISKSKTDVELSASQLFSDFENNEVEANTKYLDKVMEVEGVVKEITKDENGMTSITLEGGSDMFGVICQMDDLSKHKRTDFKEGEKVTFKGICTGVLMDVVLVRCVEV